MRYIVSAVLLVLVCGTATGQIYKWVDDKGVTHYDEKPPAGAKSKEVPIHSANNVTGAAPPADNSDLQSKDAAFRKRQAEREKAAAKQAADNEKLAAQCKYQTGRLAELQRSRRVYNVDANGERTYLDDDQRQALVDKTQQEYDQNCRQ